MLNRISRTAATGAIAFLLALLFIASPESASAHDADYSREWQDARDKSFYGDQGSPRSWGPVDKNNNNPAGFYTPEPTFFSANNRLTYPQTGDKGLHWAVAGPKDFDYRAIYNAYLPEEERGHTPRDGREQNGQMYRDLQAACLKGNWPERCFEIFGVQQEIMYSYFGNALDYRRNGYGLPGSYTTNWIWTIYLADDNGGLSWSDNYGQPGATRANYGQVATVGQMRAFLHAETQNAQASEGYRYSMARATVYLDYMYGDDNEHPIEMLMVPASWSFVCYTPRFESDGSITRDYYGNVVTEVYKPITYADPFAKDPSTRALSCPSRNDGHWEYAHESQIRGWSEESLTEITAPYLLTVEASDDSPAGVGRRAFTTQRETRLTPFGQKLDELCRARGGCDEATAFTASELAEFEAAASESRNTPGPKLDLTEDNRLALAEGRLILVGEWEQDARVTEHKRRDRWMRRWISSRTYYDEGGNAVFTDSHTSAWEYANEPDKDINEGEATFTMGTRHFTQGYQAIVNHCNGEGFDSAVGQYAIDERPTDSSAFTGTYLAGSAVSATFTNPADKPWGTRGATSEVGFYDKVCSYEGTRTDPATETSTPVTVPGANTGFRDNTFQQLPVTYYTPTSGGWVSYRSNGPLAFTATRWEGGTPVPGQFWIGGEDCHNSSMGDGYFGTSTQTPPVLRQWTLQDFSSSTVATGIGCYKRLYTRAIWASDKWRPQVLTVKWDFAPHIATVIPANNIGFTTSGDSTYDKATVGAEVRGQVVSSHAPDDITVPANQQAYLDHTGSGTANELDVPVPYGTSLNSAGQWTTAPHLFSSYYYALNMVRAVGE